MEMALREAKARLSELITAACRGERVVIAKYGRPAVELVDAPPEEVEAMEAALNDPALSRRVLGLDDEEHG